MDIFDKRWPYVGNRGAPPNLWDSAGLGPVAALQTRRHEPPLPFRVLGTLDSSDTLASLRRPAYFRCPVLQGWSKIIVIIDSQIQLS